LVFHKIVTGTPAATIECKEEDFNSIMAAIHDNGLAVECVGPIIALDR